MGAGKSDQAFRTITEAAEMLELPAHVLRFWESKFKYIKPMKRGGGRRYYRPEDINLLLGIKHLLYSEGLTIKGALKVIQSNGIKSIARLGINKITQKNNLDAQPNTQSKMTSSKVSFKSFNLDKKKILRVVKQKQLHTVLVKLQEVQKRMQDRCEKNRVA